MESNFRKKQPILKALLGLGAVVLLAVIAIGSYIFAVSPQSIRTPEIDHYHFRMQIVTEGQAADFSDERYQVPYVPNQCTGDLTAEPIHFHDKRDQFVHIHWANITGGLVLKNYGWNYIGGSDDILGYRLDELPNIDVVSAHGDTLPTLNDSKNIYVYIGDESGYMQKDFKDFINNDLETFFGVSSNFPAQASGNAEESAADALVRINNLLGNVVIFAQDQEPTQDEIKERFNNLVPLSDSTCGG